MQLDGSAILLCALRGVAFVAGAVLLYVAFLTYPGEQRQIRSRLEDWWLRLAYQEGAPETRTARFLRVVLDATTSVLDRIFGSRLLSVRALSASICYEIAAVNLAGAIALAMTPKQEDPSLVTASLLGGMVQLAAGSAGACGHRCAGSAM
jgi:hypothetical protein